MCRLMFPKQWDLDRKAWPLEFDKSGKPKITMISAIGYGQDVSEAIEAAFTEM